jgi:hypothetical protein
MARNSEVQPGMTVPLDHTTRPNAIIARQARNAPVPSQVASRSGAAEKSAVLSQANATILRSGYFVSPAARGCRM